MGETLTQKIFARHAVEGETTPGSFVNARVDLVLLNDITGPPAIDAFRRMGRPDVFDPDRVVLVPDHFTPNKDIDAAIQARALKDFADEQRIVHYYEVGRGGVEHALLPEEGLVRPGDLIVGADSHTCTYGAFGAFATGVGSTDAAYAMATGELWFRVPESVNVVLSGRLRPWVYGKDVVLSLIGRIGVDGALYQALEFSGDGIGELSLDSRLSIANMAIEAGAKAGMFPADDAVIAYVRERTDVAVERIFPDDDAVYAGWIDIDLSAVEPQVAFPHLPSNTRGLSEIDERIAIDQVVIGSCTNGRIEDLRAAARVLAGRQVANGVRLLVIPATQRIYREALRDGLIEIFLDAGAAVGTPTCGPCLGGHFGILAPGERAVATTNRNFLGRMGHKTSEVYLANPAVAAASAVLGYIGGPDDVGVTS